MTISFKERKKEKSKTPTLAALEFERNSLKKKAKKKTKQNALSHCEDSSFS